MPRPKKQRCMRCSPSAYYFKPRGIPIHLLYETILAKDELEAIKLADLDNLDHVSASKEMRISRATFGRILRSARNKVADSIINGKAIKIS